MTKNIRQRNKFREKSYDHRAKSKRIYSQPHIRRDVQRVCATRQITPVSREIVNGTKKALIIGCSTGYGLASRICALENCGADTLGIMFERQANGRRTATPGWYNTAEFHRLASGKGVYAKTINGDAFSKEIKEKAIELIKQDLEKWTW